ncbi:unnamed protein product [Penicillium olsonii]|nr:unnamed protein product [Penicillium olsonii]
MCGPQVVGYTIYQVYFHPLAQYPGPLIGKFLKMEVVHRALMRSGGDVHLHIRHCHLRYGKKIPEVNFECNGAPFIYHLKRGQTNLGTVFVNVIGSIVRYGPNVLIFNTVEGLKDIYSNSKDIVKDDCYQVLHVGAKSILTETNPKSHTQRAKLIVPGFLSHSINEFEPRIREHVSSLLTALSAASKIEGQSVSWGQPLVMSDWCSYSTLDMITDLVFGRSSNLIGQPELRHIVSDIEGMLEHASFLLHAPFVLLGRIDKLLFKGKIRGTRRYRQMIKLMMQEAGENQIYNRLAHHAASNSPSSFALSRTEICSETALLVVAVLFYLAMYKHVYERLRREIHSTFQSLEDIHTGPALQSCTYLDACLKETLRISPGVSSALYRKVGKRGAVIDGHFVPSGCSVATGIYSLHHNESYFPQPDIFIPERWLPGNESDSVSATHAAYVPFSLGTRACLGRNLALRELEIMTSAIVWQFDFKISQSHASLGAGHPLGGSGRTNPMEFQLSDHIVSHKKGPALQLRPRKP